MADAQTPLTTAEETASAAVRLWGGDAQLDMMIEECAELIQAVSHYRRGRADAVTVAREIADVRLMLDQAAFMFGADLCAAAQDEKAERLRARIRASEARRYAEAQTHG